MSLPVGEASPIPRDMELYLNRNYWDGHWPGEGDPETVAAYSRVAGNNLQQTFVKDLERIVPAVPQRPLAIYRPGDSFRLDEHPPGTVVIFERETLMRDDESTPPVNRAELPSQPLEHRPTARLARQLLRQRQLSFTPHIVRSGGWVYEDVARYGEVLLNSRHQPRLVTLPSSHVQKPPKLDATDWMEGKPGTVEVNGEIRPRLETDPIEVGEVRVQHGKNWRRQRLSRVNVLKVVSYG